MSKKIYLYRAVTTRDYDMEYEHWDGSGLTVEVDVLPAGSPIGRQTGYLSRSSAVDAGARSGMEYEIVRSEPVEFLSDTDRLRKQIRELTAELAVLNA